MSAAVRTVLVLVLLLAPAMPVAARELHSTYLDAGAMALERVLPPPPADGSPEAVADLDAVKAAIAARTPEDEARITADLPCDLDRFTGVMGPDFTAARMPKLAALIERVFQDGELVVLATKRAVARPRPYTRDPGLHTYGHRSHSTSYPSGHATFGHLAATLLARIAPEKSRALFARAEQYGRNRLQAGTHFPTDLEAGTITAAVIAETLLRDPRFQQDFEAAKAEAASRP